MADLPELGVGVIFVPGLEALLEAGDGLIDVVEVEPQSFWFAGATAADVDHRVRRLVERATLDRRPALVHGVGSPVGGTVAPTGRDMANLAVAADRLDPPWVSEHLSFNRFVRDGRTASAGLMLPPVQTPTSARRAAAHITRFREAVARPFAFETGVNYLPARPSDMTDGAWWRLVAETADCGIVDPELMAIAADVVPKLPALRAVVFEIVPEYLVSAGIGPADVRRHLGHLHQLWDRRRTGPARAGTGPAPTVTAPGDVAVETAAEQALARSVTDPDAPPPTSPGEAVMRRLVAAIRRGLTVTVLPLSLRLIRLTAGGQAVEEVFAHCWRRRPPELYADAEAVHVAEAARAVCRGRVPHLDEVLAFELALVDLARDGDARPLRFTCAPEPLLAALGRGERPTFEPSGDYELVLTG